MGGIPMSVWEGVNGAAGHLVDGLVSCAASVSDLGRLVSVAGMIVPYVVAYSLMFGAVISSGIMWPLLSQREGQWYEAGLQSQDFRGLFGYKVCLSDETVLGLSCILRQCQTASRKLWTLPWRAVRSHLLHTPWYMLGMSQGTGRDRQSDPISVAAPI